MKTHKELHAIARRIKSEKSLHAIAAEMIEYQQPRTPGQWRTICTMQLMRWFGTTEETARVLLSEMSYGCDLFDIYGWDLTS